MPSNPESHAAKTPKPLRDAVARMVEARDVWLVALDDYDGVVSNGHKLDAARLALLERVEDIDGPAILAALDSLESTRAALRVTVEAMKQIAEHPTDTCLHSHTGGYHGQAVEALWNRIRLAEAAIATAAKELGDPDAK